MIIASFMALAFPVAIEVQRIDSMISLEEYNFPPLGFLCLCLWLYFSSLAHLCDLFYIVVKISKFYTFNKKRKKLLHL